MSKNQPLLDRARQFAERAHEGQTRHGGEPYSTHPIQVAGLLESHGITDPAILAAALLHDVLEDTAVTASQLRQEFGDEITALVEELTNPDYPGRTFEEKHNTLAEHATRMSDKAKCVKLADRMHNLTDMQAWDRARQQRYSRVTLDLLAALRPWPLPELAAEIEAKVREVLAD